MLVSIYDEIHEGLDGILGRYVQVRWRTRILVGGREMKKYASDLVQDDKIVDKRTSRVVVCDFFESESDRVTVYGFFEDDGEDWTRTLDLDSIVKMAQGE
jgi:hypothetical protein